MEVKRPLGDNSQPAAAQPGSTGAGRDPVTFPELVDQLANTFGDRIFVPRRHAGGGGAVTYRQLREDVRKLARGLLARGVRRGDRVALIAENSYAWVMADLAITYIGAVDVPRGVDTAPDELRTILDHSGCKLALAETDAAAAELVQLRAALPALAGVIHLADQTGIDGVTTVCDLMETACPSDADLDAIVAEVQPEDLLTIVYTSGTTAEPKGVMLTHRNMLSNAMCVRQVLGVGGTDVFLSVLPAWHVYERIMNYLAMACGGQLVYTSRRKIKEDLRAVQPTVFAAVPRIWESIHDGIVNHCCKLGGVKGRLMRAVLHNARKAGGGRANAFGKLIHAFNKATFLRPLYKVTGGRMRIAVSGGGSLPDHVDDLLLGIGLPLLNGYGLTETSPVVCVRPPENNRVGTIGPAIPDTEIEIRDTEGNPTPHGEIGLLWIRGPQVMQGYYRSPETTKLVMDGDLWFNSGDLARIDDVGHFSITGRAKDTIVLSGGENVEPEPIETGIKSSELIDQAVVIGQDQKFLGAILIPTPECLEAKVPRNEWGEANGELTGERVRQLYRGELDRALARGFGFRPCERVARFKIRLEPMTIENGLLTPTMKVKRHEVQQQMCGLITTLFE